MISFRYHIVSIVSVFLALAIGVALGGGPLKGEVDNTLVDQVKSDRQTKASLQAQIAGLRAGNTFTDEFAATVAPTLVGDTLKGRAVTLVVLPTAQQSDVSSLADLVGVAGGTVGGTVRIGDQLVDAGDKQLVDELGNQLEGRATGLSIPADASPYERIGALIARAIGTDFNGGARGRRSRHQHPRRAEHDQPDVGRGQDRPARQPGAVRDRRRAGHLRGQAGRRHASSTRW